MMETHDGEIQMTDESRIDFWSVLTTFEREREKTEIDFQSVLATVHLRDKRKEFRVKMWIQNSQATQAQRREPSSVSARHAC